MNVVAEITFPFKASDSVDTRRVYVPLKIDIMNACGNSIVNHDDSFEISNLLMVEEG